MKDNFSIKARTKEEYDLIHKMVSELPEQVSNQIHSAEFNGNNDDDEIHFFCDMDINNIIVFLPKNIYRIFHSEESKYFIAHSRNISFKVNNKTENDNLDIDFL